MRRGHRWILKWSDAWVLLSLLHSTRPSDRQAIVDCGEYLQRAVMLPAELEGGLRRLQAAGYVVPAGDDSFDLGPRAESIEGEIDEIRESLGKWGTGLIGKEFEHVFAILGVRNPWR